MFKSPPFDVFYRNITRSYYGTRTYGRYKNLPGISGFGSDEVAAWFLGPKAENHQLLKQLTQDAIDAIVYFRRGFHPEDPPAITEAIKHSPSYLASVDSLRRNFYLLLEQLNRYATPYHSMRYQGHMLWECTLPGLLGYFATMLHNPNNVSVQASTLTTFLELFVGEDLCRMIGFEFSGDNEPWGHITADGTIANAEALWATRELKYLPVSMTAAIAGEPCLAAGSGIEVDYAGGAGKLAEFSSWQLLNLPADITLALPEQLAACCNMSTADVWRILADYSLNTLGTHPFQQRYLADLDAAPVCIVPVTKHYCWPKSAALLGLGQSNLRDIPVDDDARLDLDALRAVLEDCLSRQIPVLCTVAVLGSTEESAVDPIDGVLALRTEFRRRGLDFNVHIDAAWGGYFLACIRRDYDHEETLLTEPFIAETGQVPLSRYVVDQLKQVRRCDSVVIDPHKSGYIPYPAGSLCYRDRRMIHLVTFGAPYIGSAEAEPAIGQFGIEGSKPGAAAASVFLSHSVIRPSQSGYGKLLSGALINAKLFYLHLLFMAQPDDPFIIVPLARLPAATKRDNAMHTADLRRLLDGKSSAEILDDEQSRLCLNELGPDQNILVYAFNFKTPDGALNSDLDRVNRLNQMIYDALHVQPGSEIHHYDLLVTKSELSCAGYGARFMQSYFKRLAIHVPADQENPSLTVLRSVVMDPWMAETQTSGGDFFAIIVQALRRAVLSATAALTETPL